MARLEQDEEQSDQSRVDSDDGQNVLTISSDLGEAVLCARLPALVVGVAALEELSEFSVGRVCRCSLVDWTAAEASRGT